MARPPSRQPTEGELEILNVLWDAGPSELGSVVEALRKGRPVATTTVATMLKVMESKGLVARGASEGSRGARWGAVAERTTTRSGLLRRLIDVAFDGSAGRLVAHMLEDRSLTDADRESIRALLGEGTKKGGKA